MKTIGLLGGMSWESTALYYKIINETVRDRLGGLNSARLVLYSVNFAEVEILQHEGRWREAGSLLIECGRALERAGADFIVLCTNTMHLVADQLIEGLERPLLHIADPTGQAVRNAGVSTVGLLGTRFTMEQDFYAGRLKRGHGLEVIVPDDEERAVVHKIIYDELCLGKVTEDSRQAYADIVSGMVDRGAQAVILGCTEIGLLLRPEDVAVPIFDTTILHAAASVDAALAADDPQAQISG